jgi:hypothetical protein
LLSCDCAVGEFVAVFMFSKLFFNMVCMFEVFLA